MRLSQQLPGQALAVEILTNLISGKALTAGILNEMVSGPVRKGFFTWRCAAASPENFETFLCASGAHPKKSFLGRFSSFSVSCGINLCMKSMVCSFHAVISARHAEIPEKFETLRFLPKWHQALRFGRNRPKRWDSLRCYKTCQQLVGIVFPTLQLTGFDRRFNAKC